MTQTVENFNPWVKKIPRRREWQSTPVFLPGEFHGQRSLAGYSPWGCKELDTPEQLSHKLHEWVDGWMDRQTIWTYALQY